MQVHIRDVLVVHGSEDALEYESGSMTALRNATGATALREAFTRALLRGSNQAYMRQKWGALKPKEGEAERRWHAPFNRRALPLGWETPTGERGAVSHRTGSLSLGVACV